MQPYVGEHCWRAGGRFSYILREPLDFYGGRTAGRGPPVYVPRKVPARAARKNAGAAAGATGWGGRRCLAIRQHP